MRKHIPHIISNCNACPYVQSIDTYNFTIYHCNYSKIDVTGFYKTTGIHPDCKLIDCMYVDLEEKVNNLNDNGVTQNEQFIV